MSLNSKVKTIDGSRVLLEVVLGLLGNALVLGISVLIYRSIPPHPHDMGGGALLAIPIYSVLGPFTTAFGVYLGGKIKKGLGIKLASFVGTIIAAIGFVLIVMLFITVGMMIVNERFLDRVFDDYLGVLFIFYQLLCFIGAIIGYEWSHKLEIDRWNQELAKTFTPSH